LPNRISAYDVGLCPMCGAPGDRFVMSVEVDGVPTQIPRWICGTQALPMNGAEYSQGYVCKLREENARLALLLRPTPVTERLPEVGITVLWWGGEWFFGALKAFETSCHEHSFDWDAGELYVDPFNDMDCLQLKHGDITHWVPMIPDPPPTE